TPTIHVVTKPVLAGRWRPVSIAGYSGPGVGSGYGPPLRFDVNGRWSGSDGCNTAHGTYQLSRTGILHLGLVGLTLAGCTYARSPQHPHGGEVPPVPFPYAATRVELVDGRLTFFARDGNQIAQYERASDPRCNPKELSATFGFVNNTQVGLGGLALT